MRTHVALVRTSLFSIPPTELPTYMHMIHRSNQSKMYLSSRQPRHLMIQRQGTLSSSFLTSPCTAAKSLIIHLSIQTKFVHMEFPYGITHTTLRMPYPSRFTRASPFPYELSEPKWDSRLACPLSMSYGSANISN